MWDVSIMNRVVAISIIIVAIIARFYHSEACSHRSVTKLAGLYLN